MVIMISQENIFSITQQNQQFTIIPELLENQTQNHLQKK